MFEGFIAAGGKSSRMGRDKALLEYGGATFLERAAALVEGVFGSAAVVLNRSQTEIAKSVSPPRRVVFDIHENRGAVGAIHAALAFCRSEFAFVTAVDLPFADEAAVRRLTAVAANPDADAVVPRQRDGRLQPLFAVYRVVPCLPAFENALRTVPEASVRDVLGGLRVVEIAEEEFGGPANLFDNINRPEQFARLAQDSSQSDV